MEVRAYRRYEPFHPSTSVAAHPAAGVGDMAVPDVMGEISTVVRTLMGTSATPSSTHGHITDWDGYGSYTISTTTNLANASGGLARPKFLLHSDSSQPFSGTYAQAFAHYKSTLDTFYYNGTGQTRSTRWGITFVYLVGNENYNSTRIPDPTAYITIMQALHDAVHYIDPLTGSRRYPDALAGSNPTTTQEFQGTVQTSLHATAKCHDIVIWSMYPVDLGNDGDSITYDWPSFTESDRTSNKLGYLIRCFYRTKQAEAQARTDLGDPSFRLGIGSRETGNTRCPTDTTLRPYWAAHAMYRGAKHLAVQYDLDLRYLVWWDDGGGNYPQGQTVDGRNTEFFTDNADSAHPANPTTAQVWRNPESYMPEYGGTAPASWAGNPKTSGANKWTTSGPVN